TDGYFYGSTFAGGAFNRGMVFRLSSTGVFTVVYSFTGGADGANPAGVVQASDGNLYGTTSTAGASDRGTIFRLSLAGAFSVLHAFTTADGGGSIAPLMQAADGGMYGTTAGNVQGGGAIF